MDIANNAYGLISIRGQLPNLNTSSIIGAATGVVCYLSAATAGLLTTVIPALPNLEVAAARIMTLSTTATVTISNASPAVIGWSGHALPIGARVTFSSTISLPTGITALQHYYVMTAGYGTNAFQIELVQGSGTPINTSSAGSGVFTGYKFDGTLNIHIVAAYSLTTLTDVTIANPILDQVLRYNGAEWVNGTASTAGAGPGISFFNATPSIIATGTQNAIQLLTLSKVPITTAEQTITGTGDSASTPIPYSAWLYDAALGRTLIDGGMWNFQTWANVSNVAGTTTLARGVYAVLDELVNTVMVTTIGGDTTTLRTATASGGTPFATTKIDVGGTPLTDSYLKTTKGLLRIVSRTSDTVVHVATPSTYTDDVAGMAFSVWKVVINSGQSADINTTTASGNYDLLDISIAGAAYPITALHKLGAISFVSSTASRVVTTTYNGTTRNTHISTPLITLHNNLAGLQGGVANEYYHISNADYVGTGTGLMVRATSPTLVTPILGTPTSGNLANCTGYGGTSDYTGFKNRLINGSMRVAQRATTATVTAATTVPTVSTGYPCVDRWFVYSTGANVTAAQVAGTVPIQNQLQITGAASVTAVGVGQRIESNNCFDLVGSTCTLSVNLANSLLTTVTWTASYATTTANTFGTIGTPTKTQIATGTFTVSSTITNYQASFSVPSGAEKGIEILFTVGAQTSGTWTLGNVQFEKGAVATLYDYRDYGAVLFQCQRYYEVFTFPANGTAYLFVSTYYAANSYYCHENYKQVKFAVPTFIAVGSTWQVQTPTINIGIDQVLFSGASFYLSGSNGVVGASVVAEIP
jgi:hypothetical protein